MGAEKTCKMRVEGEASTGTVLLETDYLLFRGDVRMRLPFAEIRGAIAKDGVLVLSLGRGKSIELELGAVALRWAEKITKPKGIVDKLGVKAGARVALVGDFDAPFVRDLEDVGTAVTVGARGKMFDHVLFAAEKAAALTKVAPLAERIAPAGGVWIVYPKGKKEIREADVIAAGRAARLKDVKVARFSETHTALRFVIPVARRGA